MKAKDIDIYKLFSKTFKGRKMFGFMDYGELSRMDKVNKPIRQTEVVEEDIIELPEVYIKWCNDFNIPNVSAEEQNRDNTNEG